jgi:beta-lactamase regulating signal transducer with metallopeptidase domain
MTATLLFSAFAALLVYLAGRGNQARDPRLTVLVLGLLAIFPVLLAVLPKAALLPATAGPLPVQGAGGLAWGWLELLLALWFAGFCIAALRLAFAARGIAVWRRDSLLIGRIGSVELRCLDLLKSPVAAGIFRPMIFVPRAWEAWPEPVRRMVLEHELAHHRRHDPLWRWIAELARAIHWFNPLVPWIARRLNLQCEFACDVRVLDTGVPAGDYARLLCGIAEERLHRGPVLAMAQASELESRVRRLVEPGRRQGRVGIVLLLAASLAMAGVLASVERRTPPGPASPEQIEAELRWSADPFPGH